jgi:protein TonB
MFDAVLNQAKTSQSRFGTGAVFAATLHAGAIALVLWASTNRPAVRNQKDLAVKFMKPSLVATPPPPPPPPPLASTPKAPRIEHKIVRKHDTIVQPKEIPKEKPPEADPEPERHDAKNEEKAAAGGVAEGLRGGVAGGTIGGVLGGVPGGQVGGQLAGGVLPFGEGMTRPEKIEGEPPQYTREALTAQVQGTMLVKCVITTEGKLQNCRIIKPVPYMDKAVLDVLSHWRYKPVHYQGKAVAVDYLIQIKLVIPR